jgi:hypothetical protein
MRLLRGIFPPTDSLGLGRKSLQVISKECGLSLDNWQSECFISETGKAVDTLQAVIVNFCPSN